VGGVSSKTKKQHVQDFKLCKIKQFLLQQNTGKSKIVISAFLLINQ